MRRALASIAIVVGAFHVGMRGATASEAAAQTATRRPNAIVFLADDVGWGEFGFQGNKQIPTPHIDSIAKNGVRFTNGYVAATYCSPSRAGLLTGRYPTRYGHEFNEGVSTAADGSDTFGLPLTETTLATRLKALGYATACVGKWHLGEGPNYIATARGFDEFYGTVANSPFFNPPYFIDTRVSADAKMARLPGFYTTDAYAERAVDWLGKQKGRPFFLYLPFNAQHEPLQAPQKYLDRFAHIQDEWRRYFAAALSAMDDAVGRVLDTVRAMGEEENTLIYFLSDNGGPTARTTASNGPLRGFKQTTSEGGTRVPFCVQWKGKIPAGKVFEFPVLNLDILPTVMAAAHEKAAPAWKLDGVDLMPYLTGKNSGQPHETIYWRYGDQWAIRKGDWKLVASRIDNNQPRLIQLAEDIGEANDLSAKHPEKVQELLADWKAWSAQQREPLWWPVFPLPKK